MSDAVSMPRPAKHVAIVGNAMVTMVRFRIPLIRHLQALGCRVTAICPAGTPAEHQRLAELDIAHVPLTRMSRAGLNPIAEAAMMRELYGILRDLRPDAMLTYFLKPVLFGGLAARAARVPRRIGLIEGLGYGFSEGVGTKGAQRKQSMVRGVTKALMRASLPGYDHVFVLNNDDLQIVQRSNALPPARASMLDGIGVDLGDFPVLPPATTPVRFMLAARMIREKGVETFVDAARIVRKTHPEAQFRLLGGTDDAPGALTPDQLQAWAQQGDIAWPGHVSDMTAELAATSVFVLPSYYGEGLPRSIMEAMAAGRPVITTDAPGCRESITAGVSGFIVPKRNPQALAEAMTRFVETPELIAKMGAAAHKEAARRYDVRTQNAIQADMILGNHG